MHESLSDELIANTQRFWSEYSGKVVSREDAIEIIQNITEFFEILIELDGKKESKLLSSSMSIEVKE